MTSTEQVTPVPMGSEHSVLRDASQSPMTDLEEILGRSFSLVTSSYNEGPGAQKVTELALSHSYLLVTSESEKSKGDTRTTGEIPACLLRQVEYSCHKQRPGLFFSSSSFFSPSNFFPWSHVVSPKKTHGIQLMF